MQAGTQLKIKLLHISRKLIKSSYLLLLIASSYAQGQSLVKYQKQFNTQLRPWAQSFQQFNLAGFQQNGVIPFEAINPIRAKAVKQFYPAYKTALSYSLDGKRVIDIYDYLLLENRGNHFYTHGGDVEQSMLLGNIPAKTWLRIAYNGYSQRVQEVCWIDNTRFILAATSISKIDKMRPKIMIGDTRRKTFTVFESMNPNCYQKRDGYQSAKLKALDIKTL